MLLTFLYCFLNLKNFSAGFAYHEVYGGVHKMCGKRRAIGVIILSFSTGALLAAALPLWILAIIEAIMLIIIGWCFFSGD